MAQLERYEWCDFWWEESDKNDKPRVLFIGDSITRAYRPRVNELIKDKAYVDMLATSKALDNPSMLKELDYILNHEAFKYTVIHFSNGLHGWHLTEEEYGKWLDEVICHLIKNSKGAKIVLTLSTPLTKEGNTHEINTKLNSRVIKRNEYMRDAARKYKLDIDDLYTPMYGKSELRVDDGYHYNEEGEKIQARIVYDKIKQFL